MSLSELAIKAKGGCLESSTVIYRALKPVFRAAIKHIGWPRWMGWDDAMQECAITSWRALRSWKQGKLAFSTYVRLCCENRLRQLHNNKKVGALRTVPLAHDPKCGRVENAREKNWERYDVEKAVRGLHFREATVVALRFGLGDSAGLELAEVGLKLGVTKQRVHQIVGESLRNLRRRLWQQAGGD